MLAAPLLQLAFPRLAAAAEPRCRRGPRGARRVRPAGDDLGLARRGAAGRHGRAGGPGVRARPGFGADGGAGLADRAFAPAVVGFALLGLASRTLLAQHRARAAGW